MSDVCDISQEPAVGLINADKNFLILCYLQACASQVGLTLKSRKTDL